MNDYGYKWQFSKKMWFIYVNAWGINMVNECEIMYAGCAWRDERMWNDIWCKK